MKKNASSSKNTSNKSSTANIYIGTSGYSYQHWKSCFYPLGLANSKWLEFYSQHFKAVELNVTFYRLPPKETFSSWHKRTPQDFRFVIKGWRFITHIKKLRGCQRELKMFFNQAKGLKEKLICVLWQLPPSFKCDVKRLKDFIKIITKSYSFCLQSFEFRDNSWFNEEIYSLLNKYNLNLCIADSCRFPTHNQLGSTFIYLRFHGGKILYGSEYSEQELRRWAQKAKQWLRQKNLLFAFFNNDYKGFAVKNALRFKELLNEEI